MAVDIQLARRTLHEQHEQAAIVTHAALQAKRLAAVLQLTNSSSLLTLNK